MEIGDGDKIALVLASKRISQRDFRHGEGNKNNGRREGILLESGRTVKPMSKHSTVRVRYGPINTHSKIKIGALGLETINNGTSRIALMFKPTYHEVEKNPQQARSSTKGSAR
jgi:hypothetical protein